MRGRGRERKKNNGISSKSNSNTANDDTPMKTFAYEPCHYLNVCQCLPPLIRLYVNMHRARLWFLRYCIDTSPISHTHAHLHKER